MLCRIGCQLLPGHSETPGFVAGGTPPARISCCIPASHLHVCPNLCLYAIPLSLAARARLHKVSSVAPAQVAHRVHRLGLHIRNDRRPSSVVDVCQMSVSSSSSTSVWQMATQHAGLCWLHAGLSMSSETAPRLQLLQGRPTCGKEPAECAPLSSFAASPAERRGTQPLRHAGRCIVTWPPQQ